MEGMKLAKKKRLNSLKNRRSFWEVSEENSFYESLN